MTHRFAWILLALGLATSASAGEMVTMTDYFPLTPGLKWRYIDRASNEPFTLEVLPGGTAHGSRTMKVHTLGKEDVDEFSNDDKGIRLHGRAGRGLATPFTPPVVYCNAKAEIGKMVESIPSWRNPATGHTMTWRTRIVGFEDVVTPAGSFPRCAKLEMVVVDTGVGSRFSHMFMWFAKDVGLVKRAGEFVGSYYVQELIGR